MRNSFRRGIVLTAAIGVVLAGCGDAQEGDDGAADEQAASDASEGDETDGDEAESEDAEAGDGADGEELDEEALEDLMAEQEDLPDPNEDVQDGVYRGNGVVLPVPEGWSIDAAAFQQGVVAAVPEDGAQQLTAQAIDAAQAEAAGAEPLEFDTLLDGVREQVDQDAEMDEEVELAGADRAHRLTYLDLPGQQEGQPDSGVTIVLAEGPEQLIGEFVYSAGSEDYDESIASQLVDQAGFDPDSELPAPAPAPAPAPDEGG